METVGRPRGRTPEGLERDAVCRRIFDIQTAGLIKRLSNILRYTLSQKTEVTLGSEFDMALQYLYLQKYRR